MRKKKIITLRILFDLTPISWGKNYKKCMTDSKENLYFDLGNERLFRFETQLKVFCLENWNWKNEQLHSSSFDEEIEGSLQMKKIYTNEKYPRLDVYAQNQQILNRNQTFPFQTIYFPALKGFSRKFGHEFHKDLFQFKTASAASRNFLRWIVTTAENPGANF